MTFTYVLVRLLLFNERLPHSVRTKLFGSMSYFKNLISVLVFVPALANCQISPVICLNQGTGECYKVIFGDLVPKKSKSYRVFKIDWRHFKEKILWLRF